MMSDQPKDKEMKELKSKTPRTDEAFDRQHWLGIEDAVVDRSRELECELNGLKDAVRAYYDNGCGDHFVRLCGLAGVDGLAGVEYDGKKDGCLSFDDLVKQELARARSIHSRPLNSLHEGAAVLREEFEEFWEEVRKRGQKRNPIAIAEELVQVAAVAQRIYEDVVKRGSTQ